MHGNRWPTIRRITECPIPVTCSMLETRIIRLKTILFDWFQLTQRVDAYNTPVLQKQTPFCLTHNGITINLAQMST